MYAEICFMLYLMRSSHINYANKTYKESLGGIVSQERERVEKVEEMLLTSVEGCIIFSFVS